MNIADLVRNGAARWPDNAAVIFRDTPLSYRDMEASVAAMAAGLHAQGIGAGDRVAILLPNCPQFVVATYGTARLGAVSVPGNPLLKPPELSYMWRDAQVKAVITAPALLSGVRVARAEVPSLQHVISIEEYDTSDEPVPGYVTFADVMARGREIIGRGDALPVASNGGACAVVIYTSGTTGNPKGAMLSHRNILRNVEQVQAALRFDASDRFLTVLPLFHAFAATVCMHTVFSAGCAAVLMESFAPARALDVMERHGVTICPAVPAIFGALLHHVPDHDIDLSSLRLLVSGGAPLPPVTLAALEERFGVPVIEGDGPTECSPATSVNPIDGVRKAGSVGLPLPGVEIAIFDDDDTPVPVNGLGEIVVRGDNVMMGYLNDPEATAEAMRGGWYHTGDIGKIDEDGYIFIVDRKKDMVLVGGLNVYPREVEAVLLMHPSVADAAVIGLPDAVRGEQVTAVVVTRPGESVGERELIALCRTRLANYKVPRRVLFRAALPRGGTGKVVKRLLRKELELESTGELQPGQSM